MGRYTYRAGGAKVTIRTPSSLDAPHAVFKEARDAALATYAKGVVAAAKKEWPVKTGKSKASIKWTRTPKGVRVSASASYAGEVPLDGQRGAAWQRLVVDAATSPATIARIRKTLGSALRRSLRKRR